LSVQYDYQSGLNVTDTVELRCYLDTDANPWNGGEILVGQSSQPGTGIDTIRRGLLEFTADPAALAPGEYHVYASVHSGSRTRYLHASNRLTLLAGLTPPSLSVLGWTDGTFSIRLAGTEGHTLLVETSTNLVDWMPVATNTLGAAPWAFEDDQAGAIPIRFYRAVAFAP
jgi:hypothetical protein